MRDSEFNPLRYAEIELMPLIEELIFYAERDEALDQVKYFSDIKEGLLKASTSDELLEVFFNLSAANFLNFDYSPDSCTVLDKLLEKSILLSESQDAGEAGFH